VNSICPDEAVGTNAFNKLIKETARVKKDKVPAAMRKSLMCFPPPPSDLASKM
jgi:hypothetical protein